MNPGEVEAASSLASLLWNMQGEAATFPAYKVFDMVR